MIKRILFSSGIFGSLLSMGEAEESEPHLHVRERVAPWGTVVERVSYYLKDGKEVEHGLLESFSPDGTIWRKGRNSHGEVDGAYVIFYDRIGAKQTETAYASGVEHGPSKTWAPDGKLLFEGTWKNGEKWDGWFNQDSTSSSGIFHRMGECWTIVQRKNGKKVPGSSRVVKSSWRTWTPGRLPDQKMFIRWSWPRYEQKATYPHLDRMPAYQDVPFLIEWCAKERDNCSEAFDQLVALTRVELGNESQFNSAEWRKWWEDVGKHRPELKNQRGVRDAEAWNLAQRGRNLPMPEEPLVTPENFVLQVRFRSGDYGSVTTETLTIQRGPNGAELIRSFSTLRDGPVTEERWLPFGVKDADRVVRALGYLIDRPWLLNDEAEIEKRYWASEKKDPEGESQGTWCDDKVKGRESYGSPYYPSVNFDLRDGSGKLWWNADPDYWYGENPDRFNMSHQPVPGTVFPFMAALYPESVRGDKAEKSGWTSRRE